MRSLRIGKFKEKFYTPGQAKAICDITNAMVNVQKTELEMIKLQKDL